MLQLYAVSQYYLRHSDWSSNRFEEVRLLLAESAEQAIKHVKRDEEAHDPGNYEYEVELVDMEALKKGENLRVFGHYHN